MSHRVLGGLPHEFGPMRSRAIKPSGCLHLPRQALSRIVETPRRTSNPWVTQGRASADVARSGRERMVSHVGRRGVSPGTRSAWTPALKWRTSRRSLGSKVAREHALRTTDEPVTRRLRGPSGAGLIPGDGSPSGGRWWRRRLTSVSACAVASTRAPRVHSERALRISLRC